MNPWNKVDLEVAEMRDRIILLTEEFNKKNMTDIESYHKKLNSFIDRKLKNQSRIVLNKQLVLSTFFLSQQKRNI